MTRSRIRRPKPWYFWSPTGTAALRHRAEFVDYLRRYGGDRDDYDAAELIFGELVANVVMHAPGSIKLVVEWPAGHARLNVSDEGPPLDAHAQRSADPLCEHGRGLMIVNQLSSAVLCVSHARDGKTVSAALPVSLAPLEYTGT
jgi:anti-sigma regulatory factor (Ser/Thr protein kinase)